MTVLASVLIVVLVAAAAAVPATWLIMLFLGNVGINISFIGSYPLGVLVSTLLAGTNS